MLRLLKKNYTLLDKDEISAAIDGNSFFDDEFQRLVKNNSPLLNDKESLPKFHKMCYNLVETLIGKFDDCKKSEYQLVKIIDTVVLILSLYNAYSAVTCPSLIYRLICEVERHDYLVLK